MDDDFLLKPKEVRPLTAEENRRLDERYERELKRFSGIDNTQKKIKTLKRQCFPNDNFINFCFEKDKDREKKSHQICEKYADDFKTFLGKGTGLILYGGVGTGKTFLAACVANRLCERGHSVYFTDLQTEVNWMVADGKNTEVIEHLNAVDCLILDDFGAEYWSQFFVGRVFEIINQRYISCKPLIITTNLDKASFTDPKENKRIFSRLHERNLLIGLKGGDKRQQIAMTNNQDFANFFNYHDKKF